MRRPGVGPARRSGFRGFGGGAAPGPVVPWTPLQLPSLTWWLPGGAANYTIVAGPVISEHLDASGNNYDMTQSAPNQPDASSIGGLTAAETHGNSLRLDSAAILSDIIPASGWFFWVVFNLDAFGNAIILGDIGGTENLLRSISTGIQARAADGGGLGATNVITLTAGVTYRALVYGDGVTQTLKANGTTETTPLGPLATRANVWRSGQSVDGRIGEIGACSAIPSAGDIASLDAYLVATYGVTL